MLHYGIQNQLKMKQKIGLSTYHRLKFKGNGNKKYRNFIKKKIYSLDSLEKISKNKKGNKKVFYVMVLLTYYTLDTSDIFKIQRILVTLYL